MDVQHTTGAAMKMVYRKDNKLPMYCAATKLPIWDSVKDVYPVTIKTSISDTSINSLYYWYADFSKFGIYPDTFLEACTYDNISSPTDAAHGDYGIFSHYEGTGLFGNHDWAGADKFKKPLITRRIATYFVGLNRKVGFNFTGDIQVRRALLWYQHNAFPDDPVLPIWNGTPKVTVKVTCAVAETIEQTFNIPTTELYNFYGGGKPSGYICDIHWDNDTDTLSFV